ncbi:MAG TPA: hypothetical protein ENJ56_03895, partial [Anaerolineae bacterium]|nr:hypothetical protein [Anaerolineae bacterium]
MMLKRYVFLALLPLIFWSTRRVFAQARQPEATIVVSTLVDESDGDFSSGDNSFREAVEQAVNGDTITFDPTLSGSTIVMDGALATLKVEASITISGNVPITLSGGTTTKVLIIGNGPIVDVTIDGLT